MHLFLFFPFFTSFLLISDAFIHLLSDSLLCVFPLNYKEIEIDVDVSLKWREIIPSHT
jgi:hypothetical protein